MQAAGLDLFSNPPGDVVTAVRVPGGLDARNVVRGLRERGFEVAAGQSGIKREVFRIALGQPGPRALRAPNLAGQRRGDEQHDGE